MLHHASHVDNTASASILPSFNPAIAPAFDMKADFFGALTRGDIDAAANTFAEDGTLLFPGLRPVKGRVLVRRVLGIIRRRYEDIAWLPAAPAIAGGAWIVTSWTVRGTFRTSMMPYENEVLSLVQMDADGRIKLLSDYFKDTQAFYPSRLMAPADSKLAA